METLPSYTTLYATKGSVWSPAKNFISAVYVFFMLFKYVEYKPYT